MKFGTVAILGRPNVGKSTLLNTLLKEKIAIVSDTPQTTRTRILGVMHLPDAQIVFLDTPGLHKPVHQLNRRMIRTTLDTIRGADLLYLMVEATAPPVPSDLVAIEQMNKALSGSRTPVFLLINKVDLVKKSRLLPLIESYSRMRSWEEVVPLSAASGLNVDRLLDVTVKTLPEGEAQFGGDVLTDQSRRTLAAELVREKLARKTREEIPYVVAVEIDRFVETGKLISISALVLVEKESQKAIVIGARGRLLKMVGSEARMELERLFAATVFLELWVKVRPAWREDDQILAALGY